MRIFTTLTALLLINCSCITIESKKPESVTKKDGVAKNIIFMIVDGMGFNYVKATRIFNGQRPLSFEKLPCKTSVTTCPFEGADNSGNCMRETEHVTDSAAAATAIATGVKVSNGVISRNLMGEQRDLETILEIAKKQKKSTGIVATKLFSDATPAAFASHANQRGEMPEIVRRMFKDVQPNVVFGADDDVHRQIAKKQTNIYSFVHDSNEMKNLVNTFSFSRPCSGKNCPHVYGGFGMHELIHEAFTLKIGLPLEATPSEKFSEFSIPHLSEMTDIALKILQKNKFGFFLMVESSLPDLVGHLHAQIDRNPGSPSAINVLIKEMLEVEKTFDVLRAFIKNNPDTLLVLTADHETGGLVIDEDRTTCLGQEKCVPQVRWTSEKYEPTIESAAKHTRADVPLYAIGVGAERFCRESINNTDIKGLALGN